MDKRLSKPGLPLPVCAVTGRKVTPGIAYTKYYLGRSYYCVVTNMGGGLLSDATRKELKALVPSAPQTKRIKGD
jgi:hypothetical protein